MASLSLKNICKIYDGKFEAVKDFCMEIEDKEFIVFVGPSGCGKSTTLRMIAGLEDITSGELWIDNELVNDIEPKDRNIAMVFQNYALYPHMSVYENMAFSLKIAKVPKDVIKEKVLEAAEILGITEYLQRKPKALSGGQRQRVALGRAIVRNPKVFLLDEPLSNLDAKLRAAMRTEISRIHEKLQTTFIYVTHDQVEAMTMGTRIVVMKDGLIQQIDTPENLYKNPTNMFVASFIGTPQMNFLEGIMTRQKNDIVFSFDCGSKIVFENGFENGYSEYFTNGRQKVVLGIRPEDIRLVVDNDKAFYKYIEGVVTNIEALGGEKVIYADLGMNNENKTRTEIVFKVEGDYVVKKGEIVNIGINTKKMHIFDKNTQYKIKYEHK